MVKALLWNKKKCELKKIIFWAKSLRKKIEKENKV